MHVCHSEGVLRRNRATRIFVRQISATIGPFEAMAKMSDRVLRRGIGIVTIAACLLVTQATSAARIVVAAAPGSTPDLVARANKQIFKVNAESPTASAHRRLLDLDEELQRYESACRR